MNPIVRNVLVVIGGIVIGAIVNSTIIGYSATFVPLPEGVDPNNMEDLMNNMANFPPKNFIMPFLAHAMGTIVGAYFVGRLAASHHQRLSLIIGIVFLLGGITMVMTLPSPMWFNALDLTLAYIPMAFLGWKLAGSQ